MLVNTCAVTGEAQAKTRKAIRHLLGLPRHPRVLATGLRGEPLSPRSSSRSAIACAS